MRPVSTARAGHSSAYKHFAALGEERFPVFVAVPIFGKSGPLPERLVGLASARRPSAGRPPSRCLALIGGLIAAGSRHAELVDEARERRTATVATRAAPWKVTLTGRPGVVGQGARRQRRLCGAAGCRRTTARGGSDADPDVRRLRGAFGDVADEALRGIRESGTEGDQPRRRHPLSRHLRPHDRGHALSRARRWSSPEAGVEEVGARSAPPGSRP